jgi:heme-degrading monooxygenase HmoA
VTNWAAYDIALRQRGSLTVWFTEAAIAAWKASPRTTPGGQRNEPTSDGQTTPLDLFREAVVSSDQLPEILFDFQRCNFRF